MSVDNCQRHHLELSEERCKECGHGYCLECLVYVNGETAPPLCLQCALAISGIRRSGRPRRMGWRQRRHADRLARIVQRETSTGAA